MTSFIYFLENEITHKKDNKCGAPGEYQTHFICNVL